MESNKKYVIGLDLVRFLSCTGSDTYTGRGMATKGRFFAVGKAGLTAMHTTIVIANIHWIILNP